MSNLNLVLQKLHVIDLFYNIDRSYSNIIIWTGSLILKLQEDTTV